MIQLVKNPLAMWQTWARSLGCEDPLEKEKATHSSILAWRSPWGCKESDTTERLTHTHIIRSARANRRGEKAFLSPGNADHYPY